MNTIRAPFPVSALPRRALRTWHLTATRTPCLKSCRLRGLGSLGTWMRVPICWVCNTDLLACYSCFLNSDKFSGVLLSSAGCSFPDCTSFECGDNPSTTGFGPAVIGSVAHLPMLTSSLSPVSHPLAFVHNPSGVLWCV